jgi:cobalt/nickel transport system ATP-binding protein
VNTVAPPLAIEARDICFAYPGGIEALADVSFRAREGELVAVMGANGSGKTTLLKVLMRLLHPQRGDVRLSTGDIRQLSPAELYSRVGMVFQNPADQLFGTTVHEDVAFGPRNLGLSENEVTARVEQSLAAVGVADLRDRPIHHLSYGQQKRVCLAGLLAMQPSVLLLDEPTAGLDPCGESQMIDLLLDLNRRQKTTLIVATHCVDLLPVLADRICVLSQGRVWQEGSPHEIFRDPDHIARAGLRSPLVTQLFHRLQDYQAMPVDRLPLTVTEAQEQIVRWLAEAKTSSARAGGDS